MNVARKTKRGFLKSLNCGKRSFFKIFDFLKPGRRTNTAIGLFLSVLIPFLLGLTNGKNPSDYWPLSFIFVTAVVTFIWAIFSAHDTYRREGLPDFHPLPNWPWCFCFWLLSISLFCLDACRARIQRDFHVHPWGNSLKFSLAFWGVLALIQYLRFRIIEQVDDK